MVIPGKNAFKEGNLCSNCKTRQMLKTRSLACPNTSVYCCHLQAAPTTGRSVRNQQAENCQKQGPRMGLLQAGPTLCPPPQAAPGLGGMHGLGFCAPGMGLEHPEAPRVAPGARIQASQPAPKL